MAVAPITFAIPYYSGIDYLGRAIKSVLAQRDASWRAVVCDDSTSGDDVESFVETVGQGRVRYLRNERNLGIAGNCNRCLDVADTDLVTVLHADDELAPTYCGTLREAWTRHPRAAALFCRAEIIGPAGEPWFSLADIIKGFIDPRSDGDLVLEGEPGIRALLAANFIIAPTLCFQKSVLDGRRFPLGFRFVLDWELTTSLLLDGESLVGLPDRCYRYRRHRENETERLTRSQLRFREESAYYDRMQITARERGWDRCVELATAKRIIKLNVAYRALKSLAMLQLADARRGLRLLWEL